MKTNFARILCLVLVLLMSVSLFAACGGDDDVTTTDVSSADVSSDEVSEEEVIIEITDEDPYTIAKDADGKDIAILTPNDDGTVSMTVAEKTTLEAFLAVVTAKEGYAIKVTDAEGNEVTDTAAEIVKGMTFQVFADGADTAEVEYVIDVVTEEEIEETVSKAEVQKTEASKEASTTKNNETSKVSSNENSNSGNTNNTTNNNNTNTGSTTKIEIVLSSIWAAQYTASDATGKAWQSTLTNMQTQQGITTTINTLDADSATDTIVKDVMAGKAAADVYDVSLVMCRNIARKNAAANIFSSTTLDKSAYKSGATTSVTFGDKVYGVAFPAKSTNPMGVIYNKDLISKYASDYDIVKLYNSKKWNFDAFQEIAKLCTKDTDGDGSTDVYGFTSNTNIIGMALTANAGGTALMVNGKVEATMCNDAGVAALEWCKEMFKTDKTWHYKADINSCVTDFAAGKAAMFVSYLQYYTTIASKASFPIGFVLMPMGPDQSDYKNGVYDASLYVVPKTKEARLDDIGLWLNGVAGVGSKLINLSVTNMARNGLDATSQSIYKWVVNNMTPEFSSGAFSSEVSSQVDSSVTSRSRSPSKVMASIKTQAQKECDDYYAPLY